jgi:hypothetical protein
MRVVRFLFILSVCFCSVLGLAQVPQGFNYQAVIRDEGGNPLSNQNITLRFTIWHQDSPQPYTAYQESQVAATNDFGLVNCIVGIGTPAIGTWSSIDWRSSAVPFPWQLRTEVNIGDGFVDLGSQVFSSVPYAEVAKNAWSINGNSGILGQDEFIGTTNNDDFDVRTNNVNRLKFTGQGGIAVYGDIYMYSDLYFENGYIYDGSPGELKIAAEGLGSIVLDTDEGVMSMDVNGKVTLGKKNGFSSDGPRLHLVDGTDAATNNVNSGFLNIGSTDSGNLLLDNNEIISRNNGVVDELYLNAEGGGVVVNSAISSTTHSLYVNGTAAKPGGGSWTATSDARLKENVQPYDQGLKEVIKIEPVTYHYIKNTGHDTATVHVGVIAQELQKVSPDMVKEAELELIDGSTGDYLSVDPSAFTYMLINAVKELKAENEALQTELASLKSMESRIAFLEQCLLNAQGK